MHNLSGRQPATLNTFSGVITLSQPHDIPEAGSPRTVNTDFNVGSVYTRQGLENNFIYENGSAGPNGGGNAVSSNIGDSIWSGVDNVLVNSNVYATTILPIPTTSNVSLSNSSISTNGWFNPDYALTTGNLYATVGIASVGQNLTIQCDGLNIPTTATVFSIETSFVAFSSPRLIEFPNFAVTVILNGQSATLSSPNMTTTAQPMTVGGDYNSLGLTMNPTTVNAGFTVQITAPYVFRDFTDQVNLNSLVITVSYSLGESNPIKITQFGFNLSNTSIPQGFIIKSNANANVSGATLFAQLIKNNIPVGNIETMNLSTGNASTSILTFGGINDLFGTSWSYSDINNTHFGVQLTAQANNATSINVGYTTITPYFFPAATNFNYVKTYEDDFGDIYTLALDSDGTIWNENVNSNLNVLSSLMTGLPANSYISSFTADNREYMAISNLNEGNYQPMQIVGAAAGQNGWQDRISQVGPGAAPAFQGTLQTGNIANITAYNGNSNVVILTANNNFTAGEVVTLNITSGPTYLNSAPGPVYNVLGTGLSSTQFEVAYLGATGSGAATGNAIPQYTYPIKASPNGITQFPFWNSSQGYQSQLDDILWSAGPGSTNAGTVITIYYLNQSVFPNGQDVNLINAFNSKQFPVYVYVSGVESIPIANGIQLVTGVGVGYPPGAGGQRFYFTFNVPSSGYKNAGGGSNAQPGQYQLTLATLTTNVALPGVTTGDSITLSQNDISSWNETWQIVNALNSGIYSISQTSMDASGVATYNWALSGATATAPQVGQLVTVINTTSTNNPSGTYNVTDAVITAVTGTSSGTFQVSGFNVNNVETVIQSGALATTSGTIFQFDPAPAALGIAGANPIYGNSGGGYITLVGTSSVVIGTGTRQGTVIFITRDGYYSPPAPPVTFDTSENTNYLLVSNIPTGPDDVIARAIILTEAAPNGVPGSSFYMIPNPVTFVFNGVTYQSSSFIINDNTTTQAKLTFTDQVLLNSDEVDIQGNNLFALQELGNSAWCTQYAGRSVFGRVNNKIQNFINLSFDGGYLSNPNGNISPLGWNLDPNYNNSNSLPTLHKSPIFGQSFYISNQTGNTANILGMITQSAYQDYNGVPILQDQTPYSIRVVCRTPSSSNIGNLVIDTTEFNVNSGYGQTIGSYVLPTANMTSFMQEFTGTLITNGKLIIPSDLKLRLYAQNLPNGADIEVDRMEIFPTLAPQNLTGLTMSYVNQLSSFDGDTGGIDTAEMNAQPANGAFVILNKLYVLKESSLGYIDDVPGQEPSNWNPIREVSNKAGASGINAYDVGEEWAIMACQNGLYGFNGGAPVPLMLEIPDIWSAINWNAGNSIVLRNDTITKRILCAVPMTTPNQWCPNFPVNNNPTTPNVILMLNYSGIGSIEELINGMAMHVTIVGKVAVHDLKRKWSLWSIPTPYMNLIKRGELFTEMLFGNGIGSGKIYNLGSYKSGQDDGNAFTSSYCTYGFVDPEKAKEVPIFGPFNKEFVWYDTLIRGNGNANVTFFQNSLSAKYPYVSPGGIQLFEDVLDDTSGPLDETCQRMFVEVSTNGANNWFNMSRFSLVAQSNPWNPIESPQGSAPNLNI